MTNNIINEFLDPINTFAVIGVSRDETKYGRKVFNFLKNKGFKVFPINPKVDLINGEKCYSSLDDLPVLPDVVSFIVPPSITKVIVEKCRELGINKVWLQPGSESEEVIKFCKDNNIECVHNQCVLLN